MNFKSVQNDLYALIKTPYSDQSHLEKAICTWVGKNIQQILEALDIASNSSIGGS